MYDKVFISYAAEDLSFAEKLYDFLQSQNFVPWLDKKKLLPGQDWHIQILKALREANYIILMLSERSVRKRGYVQREFKLALDYVEEKLEDDIYLIPFKIGDCEIPQRLSRYQWVVFHEDGSFHKILGALRLQQQKYVQYEKQQIAAKEGHAFTEVIEEAQYKSSPDAKLKFVLHSEYLQFIDSGTESLRELNAIIHGKKVEHQMASRKEMMDVAGDIHSIDFDSYDWWFDYALKPHLISRSVVSCTEHVYAYTGGAHGNGLVQGLNFRLHPLLLLYLEDFFAWEDHKTVLNFLSLYCYQELRKRHNEWLQPTKEEIKLQTPESLFFKDSLLPEWKNFRHYLIGRKGFEIIFNTGSVGPHAFSQHTIHVPFDELVKLITKPRHVLDLQEKVSTAIVYGNLP